MYGNKQWIKGFTFVLSGKKKKNVFLFYNKKYEIHNGKNFKCKINNIIIWKRNAHQSAFLDGKSTKCVHKKSRYVT